MIILLAGGLLTLIILAFLVWPLIRGSEPDAAADREVAIYEDQLAEVSRDLERGVVNEDQAKAARTEIERRLLAALRRREEIRGAPSRAGRLAMVAALAATPLIAILLYLNLGSMESLGASRLQPSASPERAQEQIAAEERHPELMSQIAGLEERLANEPEDIDGQALLARTYARIGEYEKALDAYQTVNRLSEGRDPQLAGEMAEVMVIANDGMVTENARQIFALIAEDFPNDPQSTYYLALHKAQNGDEAGAVSDLMALRETAEPGAPWRPAVDRLLADLSPDAPSIPAPTAPVQPARGPTAEQMAAAQDMTPEQQAQMIEGMVSGLAARLEENPDDIEGWKRLARAYVVLERPEDAEKAYREVLKRDPQDPAARAFLDNR